MKMRSLVVAAGLAAVGVLGVAGSAGAANGTVHSTTDVTPMGLTCVNIWDDSGVLVGQGCFNNVGDHVFAYDAKADGLWVRTDWTIDAGRDGECEDPNSEGEAVDCNFDLPEDGRLRFQVELWDGDARHSETEWTGWLPIGQ